MNTQLIKSLLFLILITACSTNPLAPVISQDTSLMLNDILDQVNDAILNAKTLSGEQKVPEILSVQLDLQIEANKTKSAKIPLIFISPQGDTDRGNMHRISLSFKPKAKDYSNPSNQKSVTELTDAIGAIYQTVTQAQGYQFQRGSVQIQCTFRESMGTSAGAGTGTLTLVPLQVGIKYTRQSIQTITLNFSSESVPKYETAPVPVDQPPPLEQPFM